MKLSTWITAGVLALASGGAGFAAPIQIDFWHPNLGPIDAALQKHIDGFNKSQTKYKVVGTGHGTYDETFNAAIAAYRAGKQPHLLVVIGRQTESMVVSGVVYPVQDLLADSGYQVDWTRYIQPILNYYRTKDGKLLSLPFNVSTPILWYNKDAFAKVGIAQPPETWDELGKDAKRLHDAGFECAYTSAWQQWVHVDSYSFMQNLPIATKRNGLDGLDAKYVYNTTGVVKHIAQLQQWVRDGLYTYAGRGAGNATPAFISGHCPILTDSSAGFASIMKGAAFPAGAALLPHDAGVEPHNSLIGGGSIWVMKGRSPADYKGVAAFLAYLTKPVVQATWHEDTGYVPLTKDAYEKVKASGYYKAHPQQEVAIKQLEMGTPTDNTLTVRLGDANKSVAALDDELEYVWSDKKTAQQALDDAVQSSNKVLRQFESRYEGK